MKTRTFLFAGALLLASATCHATVWRVNSQGFSANFTNLQSAINGSGSGDTIHLEPSSQTYGDAFLDRPLTIIGPGYKLGQEPTDNQGLQARAQTSKVGWIYFEPGSEGSRVSGLHFLGSWAQFNDGAGNYVVSRCYFEQGSVTFNNTVPLSNVLITQCYFFGGAIRLNFGTSSTQSNVTITNNYLRGYIQTSTLFSNNWVVTHNVFDGPYNIDLWDSTIMDNVFNESNAIYANNNNFAHNLCASSTAILPSGSENHHGLVIEQICVLAGSDDARWHLLDGVSGVYPASDGTEIGIYGGTTPYTPSGIPAIPAIYELSTSATAIQGQPLSVTLSTRSND